VNRLTGSFCRSRDAYACVQGDGCEHDGAAGAGENPLPRRNFRYASGRRSPVSRLNASGRARTTICGNSGCRQTRSDYVHYRLNFFRSSASVF